LQDEIPYSRALLLKAGVYASFKEGLTFTGKEGKIKEKVYGIFSISLCKNISVINVFGGLHPTKKELGPREGCVFRTIPGRFLIGRIFPIG